MQSDVSTVGTEEDRSRTVDEVSRQLEEAREQQVATSEILRVISTSPTDARPVFTAIAKNAVRLCNAMAGAVFSFDGTLSHFVADFGFTEDALRLLQDEYPIAPRGLNRQALMDRAVVHVVDMLNDPRVANLGVARTFGHRSQLVVPMLQTRRAIGTIVVYGAEPVPFSDAQITLLQTFADQAVIAVENTRLFEEMQSRTRELQEALDYQTATSEVLGVISRSPTDVQPVFNTIAHSAARLCGARMCFEWRFDGEFLHFAASHGLSPEAVEAIRRYGPIAPGRANTAARSILSGAVEQIPDVQADPDYQRGAIAKLVGFRSVVAVPMLKEGRPIGAIAVGRVQTGHFPERQIDLLRTFADQAVIAIENTRLFEAEQASKRELQESLEYQTATSEVLNVISRSPTELQPVLDAIAATAARLCESMDATVWRVAGGRVRVVAQFGSPIDSSALPLTRGSVTGRAIVDRKTIHVHDLAAMVETEYPDVKEVQQRIGHRTTLATPLLSQGEALGAISVRKNHVHPFSDRQITLLQTFADQAVIAIENVRLFEQVQARTHELSDALERQTATSEVLNVITSHELPVFERLSLYRFCVRE